MRTNTNHNNFNEIDPSLLAYIDLTIHELKTPVSILKAYLQVLERQIGGIRKEGDLTIDKMHIQLDKLTHLVADIQDGFSNDSSRFHCFFRIQEPLEILKDSIVAAKQTYKDFQIDFHSDLSNPFLYFDKERIEQVLYNLLANAVKYGGTKKLLTVTAQSVNDAYVISVADNGPGIPMEERAEIFKRFHRIDCPSKSSQPGFGLGLFICSQIIEKHRGQIGVDEADGGGASFWFSLPIHKKD